MVFEQRQCGVLMPVASLAGPYGIGSLGKSAARFVDFLSRAGQSVWQILPLSPTSFGDSPYQSPSAFAGNPYFIDLDTLRREGLLKKGEYENEAYGANPRRVDYAALYETRYKVLRTAFERFSAWYPDDYYRFCWENRDWIEDYALFMTAKGLNGGRAYLEWEDEGLRLHKKEALDRLYAEHEKEVHFWKFLQYEFTRQWDALHAYAKSKGVSILGDIPIYVSADSADVWANRELFLLDENGVPKDVAGCPPDYFSPDGQLWGNPLYAWDAHEKTKFAWWVRRIRFALAQFDSLRIDHFRGFDTYYAIPYGSVSAVTGEWRHGPGMKLFSEVRRQLGDVPIVAEDLGDLCDSVYALLRDSGFPGMKVLQFAFDAPGESEYQPHTYPRNCVASTDTPDNDPTLGWWRSAPPATKRRAAEYLGLNEKEGFAEGMMRGALQSPALWCILPMQDWLGTGARGRINTPSTLGGTNWTWRVLDEELTAALEKRMRTTCARYGRH